MSLAHLAYKVAAVQAAPAFLDLKGSVECNSGSRHIAQWIIDPDGDTIAQRRKIKPARK